MHCIFSLKLINQYITTLCMIINIYPVFIQRRVESKFVLSGKEWFFFKFSSSMQKCCKLGSSCVFLVFSARAWTRANFCDHVTRDRGPAGLSILRPNFVLSSIYSTFFVFLLTAGKLGYYSWENLVSSEWVWLEHADLCNGFTPTLLNFYLFLVKLKKGTNFLSCMLIREDQY